MVGDRFQHFRPSLRRWSRGFAILWLTGAVLAAPVSVSLLDQIYDDAQTTYSKEIPSLLDRNRNAVKLERLSSFMRIIATAHEVPVERRALVQLQTLAQGFDLDGDARLSAGAAHVVSSARKMVALHAALRRPAAASGTAGPDRPNPADAEAAQEAQKLADEAIQSLASLTDYVSTDAALTADRMANRIQVNAAKIKRGCLAALAFFVAFGLFFLWFFQTYVLSPIEAAVRGLASVSASDDAGVTLARARFFELDMIGRSVEQYARFAGDLRTANSALRALSSQDGLTGLANRRSFDADLGEACRRSAEGLGSFALLLIDIDHFKLLNDRFGHLVGDQCLRQVGMTLQSFCSRRGDDAARYGGEEFAVILADVSAAEALDIAERLRATIERTQLYAASAQRAIDVTVSVGVMQRASGSADPPDQVIRGADEALYRAKRSGRNRVCASDAAPEAERQTAA